MHHRLHQLHQLQRNTCNTASYLLLLACKIKDWYHWWNTAASQAACRICPDYVFFTGIFFSPKWSILVRVGFSILCCSKLENFKFNATPQRGAQVHKSYLHFNQAIIYSTLPRTFLFGHFQTLHDITLGDKTVTTHKNVS